MTSMRSIDLSRLKSDLVANVDHEMRTPLQGILGMAELLLESELTGMQRVQAEAVRRNAERLIAVIEDGLEIRAPKEGRRRAGFESFDLRGLLLDVTTTLTAQAASAVRVACLLDDALPFAVCGDPRPLREALARLLGNALKCTQAGEVVVRGAVVGPSGEHITVRVSISDTGIGVEGGMGLGLAVARQLVAMLGGEAGVESGPGRGRTIWFTARFLKDVPRIAAPAAVNGGGSLERLRTATGNGER
jgi:signal transduction histidine kinase